MKLVGLILVGLCAGFVSGEFWNNRKWFDPFNHSGFRDLRRYHPKDVLKAHLKSFDPFIHFGLRDLRSHLSKDDLNAHCEEIYNDYSLQRVMGFSPFIKNNILKFCGNLYYGESSKHVSTEIPPSTESDRTPVLVSSSEIRYPKLLNSFRSEEKIAKYRNLGAADDFSTETFPSLKRNADSTNPKISEDFSSTESSNESGLVTEIANLTTSIDDSIKISKEKDETIEISTPEVSDDSSSTEDSNATKKSTETTNTTISDDLSEQISEVTDETKETTNSTAPDVHTSDETSGVTAEVEYSTIPEKKEPTESLTKLTGGTSVAKDSSSASTPVTTISKVTSDETTLVPESLETSSVTAGKSESTNSEISESPISSETTTKMQTTSDEYHSTTPKNTVFISTDYSTSEKAKSDIVGESSSTTVPSSSSVQPNIASTTRLYSTERITTVTSYPRSQETTLNDIETTHSIITIELPGTRTLKLAVSITFLAIALISSVVLIVYFLATRRQTFSYDELLLIP